MTVPDPLNRIKRGEESWPWVGIPVFWAGCFEFRCLTSVKRKSYGESASRQDSGAFPELGVLTNS